MAKPRALLFLKHTLVNKRFVLAVAVGGLIGAGAVAGFGPYVRSKVRDKAERYGLDVSIERVSPTLDGVRKRSRCASTMW